jgi:hypothetical protein
MFAHHPKFGLIKRATRLTIRDVRPRAAGALKDLRKRAVRSPPALQRGLSGWCKEAVPLRRHSSGGQPNWAPNQRVNALWLL